jgi:outer membrane protein assembly factor BamB
MRNLVVIPVIFIYCFISSPIWSQKTYGWLGPERSGIYPESGLFKSWPAKGPALLWETEEIGTGYSSACVTNDAIYISGRRGEKDYLTAFSQDGKRLWETAYGKASDSNYPDSRGTATVYNDKIYIVSGLGDLVCMNKQGKILWSVNYCTKYDEVVPDFGISECVLVADNKVIATPGGKKASMVAFSADNGSVLWETPSIGDVTQYVNPVLIEANGKKYVITLAAKYLFAVELNTGKLAWKFDYMAQCTAPDRRFAHINTPLYRDGCLFISSGYDKYALK